MMLAECQDWISSHAPNKYYATRYRAMEADYLPTLCGILEQRCTQDSGLALDVGPGWGTMGLWLGSRGWAVTLLDRIRPGHYITPATLAAFQDEVRRGINFTEHDILTEPLPTRFDLILMTQVIPHLKYRPDRAVRNVAAMMNPGGLFVVTVLDRAAYPHVRPAYELWRDVPERGDGQPSTYRTVAMYDKPQLTALLLTSFEAVEVFRPKDSTCIFAICRSPK